MWGIKGGEATGGTCGVRGALRGWLQSRKHQPPPFLTPFRPLSGKLATMVLLLREVNVAGCLFGPSDEGGPSRIFWSRRVSTGWQRLQRKRAEGGGDGFLVLLFGKIHVGHTRKPVIFDDSYRLSNSVHIHSDSKHDFVQLPRSHGPSWLANVSSPTSFNTERFGGPWPSPPPRTVSGPHRHGDSTRPKVTWRLNNPSSPCARLSEPSASE